MPDLRDTACRAARIGTARRAWTGASVYSGCRVGYGDGVVDGCGDGVADERGDGVTDGRGDGVADERGDGVTDGRGDGVTDGRGDGERCPKWRPRCTGLEVGRPMGGRPFGLFSVPPPCIGLACGCAEAVGNGEAEWWGCGLGVGDAAKAGVAAPARSAAASSAKCGCFMNKSLSVEGVREFFTRASWRTG